MLKNKYSYIPILIFLILFPAKINAQFTSLSFQRISLDQGLSNNSINDILQTSDGFLWIATKDGLNRFDGKNYQHYKFVFNDTTSLPQNYVMSLLEDSKKNFWVGTWGGGLTKFIPETEMFEKYKSNFNYDNYIQCLYEDNNNNIWFGTLDGGLNKLNQLTNEITNYGPFDSSDFFIPSSNISSINIQDSILWIGTWDSGLLEYNLKQNNYHQYLFHEPNENVISNHLVWQIFEKNEEEFLLATENGVVEFNLKTKDKKYYLIGEVIRQIFKDDKNRIWIGTYNYHGIFLYSNLSDLSIPEIILQYSDFDPNSLTSSRIRSIFQDNSNNIWIGTEDGLNNLSASKEFYQYHYYPSENSIVDGRVVSSLLEVNDNYLYVGYGGVGFSRINLIDNSKRHFQHSFKNGNSFNADDVVCLFQDSDGIIWIGTSHGGLNSFNPINNKFQKFVIDQNNPNSIKSNWVHQVIEINENELLIGTNSSLEIFNKTDRTFKEFIPNVGSNSILLPDSLSVNALMKDSKNNIWIGTWLDGLYQFEVSEEKLYHFIPEVENKNSISSNKITSICEDSKKNIWIGTHSGGLNMYDQSKKSFKHYSTENGMPNDVVFGMAEDKDGYMWISTMRGLVKLNPKTSHIRIYDKSDGIINNQFNWHAYFKNKSGKMYFGGINGFVSFNPADIKIDSSALPVTFTNLTVNDKSILNSTQLKLVKEIELDYYQNFFSVEFTVLDFMPEIKHNYFFMLEGLDKDWIEAGKNTTASYTDVKPGNYIFKVKAANADGFMSEISELNFIISPAWWMTWWFQFLFVILLVSIIITIYRVRVNRLLEIERLRLNISRDLHDEIGSNLSSISVESQMLLQESSLTDEAKIQLSAIKKTSVETMDAIRDIIWFINPKNESPQDFLLKFRETAAKLLVEKQWNLITNGDINLGGLNLEAKRNLFLIYKEVLNNVVKHSQASKCDIEIRSNISKFELLISDNGIGFDILKVNRKSGLVNIQNRAEQINAKLDIVTKINSGTKIILEIKK